MRSNDEHFFTHDHQFSVTAAIEVASNPANNSVAERYNYSAYGEVSFLVPATYAAKSVTSSEIGVEYLYTGRRLDPVTGLQLNRNRYYHAKLGRWINRDPLGYVDGMNLYGAYFVPGGMDFLGMLQQEFPVSSDIGTICGAQNCIAGPQPQPPSDFSEFFPPPTEAEIEEEIRKSCCDEAKSLGLDLGNVGGVIFCKGRLVSCVWISGGSGLEPATDTEAIEIIDACVLEHEDAHHDDQDWSQCPPPDFPPRRPTVNRPDGTFDRSECKAYTAEVGCLRKGRAKCTTAECDEQVSSQLKIAEQRKAEHCRKAAEFNTNK